MGSQELGFLFTGLCSYLESKNVLDTHEFSNFLIMLLNDERNELPEESKEELKNLVEILFPLRVVK